MKPTLEWFNVVTDTHDLVGHLEERFGLREFRAGQEDVIRSLLEGEDCLCIMPTGGGKSLCYQLPSVIRDGTTLVLSPLIALMKDQVDALSDLGIKATSINSTLSAGEQAERIREMRAGAFDLVYIAPERLRSPRFQDAIRETNIQLLAVDEAHCISEWGHDFRPDYARIGEFRESLDRVQTIALTATATPLVREDVIKQLGLEENARTWITGFSRPNLKFSVRMARSQDQKKHELIQFLQRSGGNGIIYAATRKGCDELREVVQRELKQAGDKRRVGVYHAGLLPDERKLVQEQFMNDERQIVIATNAFGMGIDKSDLRFVVHYNAPGSIEAYYQEAGRAGRDGFDSECLLLFSAADRYIQEFFIENAYPPMAVVGKVYQFLRSQEEDPIEITQQTIRERLSLSVGNEAVSASERILEKSGALERLSARQNMAAVRIESDLPTLVDLLPKDARSQRKVLRALERVVGHRRYERVFFNLARVLDEEELDRTAWNRAVKPLSQLDAIDYIPPFRGRAIHMLQPERSFNEIEIDLEQFERRKAEEYSKLQRVVTYARSRRCRQMEILDYFGDPHRQVCGRCDTCDRRGSSVNQSGAIPDQKEHVARHIVRMILSGVARSRGRFGKSVVCQMLAGSQSAKVKRFGLDKLSTYGLLADLKQTQISDLVDQLIDAQFIDQVDVDRFRPVMKLTADGVEFMRDDELALPNLEVSPVLMGQLEAVVLDKIPEARPQSRKPSGVSSSQEDGHSQEHEQLVLAATLIESLRTWRREVADVNGVAPIRLLADATLEAIARSKPLTVPELQSITGWDNDAAAFYGNAVLEIIVEHTAPATPPGPSADGQPGEPPPDCYWTWRLISAGFSMQESQQIRQMTYDRVRLHLEEAAKLGYEVKSEWLNHG